MSNWNRLTGISSCLCSPSCEICFLPYLKSSMCCIHILYVGLVTCTHTHLCVSLPWPKWKHVCPCVSVLPPITAHPSRLPVDLARAAEFEAGRRSDAGVGGLLYTGPPSSSCQINQSLAEWFGEHDIPPSLTLSLSAFYPPLSVCSFQPPRARTQANSNPESHTWPTSPHRTWTTLPPWKSSSLSGVFSTVRSL